MDKPPNYLDFLVAFDDHIQAGNLAYVISGHELFGIAHAGGTDRAAGPESGCEGSYRDARDRFDNVVTAPVPRDAAPNPLGPG